jgi:hypothetical protein
LSYGLAGMAAAWLAVQSIAGVWAVWRTHRLGSEVPAPVM